MTLEQASVAIKHSLPVRLTNTELIGKTENIYKITQISKYIPKYENTFSYSATISRNGRAEYNVPLYSIEPHPEFERAYNVFIDELHKQNLKYYISIYLDEGGNKTTITKLVKELIDNIRKENQST